MGWDEEGSLGQAADHYRSTAESEEGQSTEGSLGVPLDRSSQQGRSQAVGLPGGREEEGGHGRKVEEDCEGRGQLEHVETVYQRDGRGVMGRPVGGAEGRWRERDCWPGWWSQEPSWWGAEQRRKEEELWRWPRLWESGCFQAEQ